MPESIHFTFVVDKSSPTFLSSITCILVATYYPIVFVTDNQKKTGTVSATMDLSGGSYFLDVSHGLCPLLTKVVNGNSPVC